MSEINVRVYGGWTSYTYMKETLGRKPSMLEEGVSKETSCNCFKWGSEGVKGEEWWGRSNQCTI
jgi:hypothetical protein